MQWTIGSRIKFVTQFLKYLVRFYKISVISCCIELYIGSFASKDDAHASKKNPLQSGFPELITRLTVVFNSKNKEQHHFSFASNSIYRVWASWKVECLSLLYQQEKKKEMVTLCIYPMSQQHQASLLPRNSRTFTSSTVEGSSGRRCSWNGWLPVVVLRKKKAMAASLRPCQLGFSPTRRP